ncbi:MAG: Bpu10I family restriction endonuclease [Candidatus Omnitrophica bacterium]|nr:Bpu10I family restriction endonuclease [Candidatus Omnitrophota bacterium]
MKLKFKKKKIHAGFEVNSRGMILPKEKDVDCCLVKAESGSIGQRKLDWFIPVVAIEVKTYLDATMWNEAQYSAILLKRVNSSARVYVFAEDNQVRLSKITRESPIDDVFVIRSPHSRRINPFVVFDFLQQIRRDLKMIIMPTSNIVVGRLINR